MRDALRAAFEVEASKALTFDECAKATLPRIELAGATSSTQRSGRELWRSMPRPYSANCRFAPWSSGTSLRCSSRFGLRSPKRRVECEVVSRPCSIGLLLVDSARLRIRPAGRAVSEALPRRSRVRAVRHHPALPYADMGAFMQELRQRTGVAAAALEFAILTAARTCEVLGANWDEFDLKAKVWTIRADRMKSGREHRVPLSAPAASVLKRMQNVRQNDNVFPGDRTAALSNMALLMLLRRMGHDFLTVHGFRSTLRDWAAERTNFPNEVAEMALAHVVSGKAEAAYRRGDLFEKRRKLMEAWAAYCDVGQFRAEVIPLRQAKRRQSLLL